MRTRSRVQDYGQVLSHKIGKFFVGDVFNDCKRELTAVACFTVVAADVWVGELEEVESEVMGLEFSFAAATRSF
jgi:hypothetical protein